MTVFDQGVLLGYDMDTADTASPKTPKQWHGGFLRFRKFLALPILTSQESQGLRTWARLGILIGWRLICPRHLLKR